MISTAENKDLFCVSQRTVKQREIRAAKKGTGETKKASALLQRLIS
ncbi:hypothetical protein ACE02P_18595 [Shewanella bicestrii]